MNMNERQLAAELRLANDLIARQREINAEQHDEILRLMDDNERLRRVISSAMSRHLDPEKQRECKWLVELPMTDTEKKEFDAALAADEKEEE